MKHFFRIAMTSVLMLVLSTLGASAQNKTFKVTGQLLDSESGEGIPFATVSLVKNGATTPYKYILSDDAGKVSLEGVAPGAYTVKAELLGYVAFTKNIVIKDKPVDLGQVKMSADKEMLEAAQVTAAGNPIVMNKDTVEYNATSFKTTDNDVLADLLKKLPGIEVSDAGAVTFNGETITKITIDGKTFFLDDPQLATKNIPAKIVNKIKVFEKKSEQAEFTGIDDGNEETVIDLSIKPGMMKGMFGNLSGGIGHDVPSQTSAYNDYRYQGSGFIGRFTDKTHLSLILNANNTNNRGSNDISGGMMGGMRGGSSNNGITSSYMGGLNAASEFFDGRMELGGNYVYNGSTSTALQSSNQTTYRDNFNIISDKPNTSNITKSQGHRFGVRLEHKFSENTSILFQPQVNFGTGSYSDGSDFTTSKDYLDGNVLLTNKGWTSENGDNRNWTTNGFFLFRQRLGIPGRTLTANIDYNFSNNELAGLNQSLTTEYGSDGKTVSSQSVVNQRQEQVRKSSSLGGRITYTEPLGNHFYVEGNYSYTWSQSNSVKDTWNSGEIGSFEPGWGGYSRTGETKDDTYSNWIENRNVNQNIGVNMLYQDSTFRAQVGLTAQPTITNNRTYSEKVLKEYNDTTWNFAPQAMVWWDFGKNSNARLFYMGRSSQPSTSQLMPVPDNSDPMRVSFGNPSLAPYFSHSLRGEVRLNNRQKYQSFSMHFNGGVVQSPIVNAIWYDTHTVQYTMPFNGPNSFNGNVDFFFNLPLWQSDFSVSNTASVSGSKRSSYVSKDETLDMTPYYKDGTFDYDKFLADNKDLSKNFAENTTRTLNVNERLNFTYRNDNLELRLGGSTRYQRSWYTIASKSTTDTWNNRITASFDWDWEVPGITIKSDASYNWYRGYTTNQPSRCILNAEIMKLLFNNTVTLAIRGYDLLSQDNALSISDTDNYHMETVRNTLGRYVILAITYRFGTMGRRGNRGSGMPMGGPGGGPGAGGPPPGM